jgi:hypothetical protein
VTSAGAAAVSDALKRDIAEVEIGRETQLRFHDQTNRGEGGAGFRG